MPSTHRAQEAFAKNGHAEIYTISEGSGDSPAIVLANGLGSTSVTWSRQLIDPLLGAGFRVIRFDSRDVGRSTRVPATSPYTMVDMAVDVEAVLDRWEVDRAHLLGRSMGGAVSIEVAVRSPSRVSSLVLVYTSAAMMAADAYGLPWPSDEVLESMAAAAFAPPPSNDEERIAKNIGEARLMVGTRYPFDEDRVREEAAADIAHAPYGEHGHANAVVASPPRVEDLLSLEQPALILHGTADAIIPIAHGRLLADRLPNSKIIEFEGLGHEMPPAWCGEIAQPIIDHLSAAEAGLGEARTR